VAIIEAASPYRVCGTSTEKDRDDIEQPHFGHPVQMEGREPRLHPGVPRGLFAPHRFLAVAQIQVQPLASRLSQQRHRHEIGGIHGCPLREFFTPGRGPTI